MAPPGKMHADADFRSHWRSIVQYFPDAKEFPFLELKLEFPTVAVKAIGVSRLTYPESLDCRIVSHRRP